MVVKVSSSLPQRIFSTVVPQNRVVRVALLLVGAYAIYRVVRSLINRVDLSPGKSTFSNPLTSQGPNEMIVKGTSLLKNKNLEGALRKFLEALHFNINDPIEIERAILILVKLIDDVEEKSEAQGKGLHLLGRLYLGGPYWDEATRKDQALSAFEKALECRVTDLEKLIITLRIGLIDNLSKLAVYESAIKQGIAVQDENLSEVLMELAETCLDEKPALANRYIYKAIEQLPENSDLKAKAFGLKAEIHCSVRVGYFDDPLYSLEEAFNSNPDDKVKGYLHYVRGVAHFGLGKQEKAIEDFKEAQKLVKDEKLLEKINDNLKKLETLA